MKVLYISSILTIHDYRMLKSLALNHSVCLVAFKESELPDNIKQIKGLIIYHLPVKYLMFEQNDNLAVKVIKIVKNNLNFIKKLLYLKRVIKKVNPDIIHAGWIQEDGYFAALSNFHPLVLMPWGSDIFTRPQMNKKQMLITKYTLSKVDKIICDCEAVKKRVIEISGKDENKIAIFRWGVDLNLFNPRNINKEILKKIGWDDKKIVISTRSFEEIYGLEYIAKAVPKIIKEEPDARFIFCGEGSEKEKIVKIVKDLGMKNYVHFAGYVEPLDLPLYLNSADIYISSSLSDGTSISLLEAFACGKPVVVTDVPSNLEWVKDGENGSIVPRRDSEILADKIITILKNEDTRRKMGHKNIEIVRERADWNKNFEIIENVYREVAM